ncbi:MAG: GNAT family N-acetyltransferase [Caulobacteraceae bacterium]|nr:GNAT family N-acetyltransferase [Caulobacteraceae bacterium]
MAHPLDRPLWNALTGRLKAYALGDEHAVRIDPDLGVFLAAADDGPESRASLNALAARYPGSGFVELEGSVMEAVLPDQPVVSRSPCAQMTCAALTASDRPDIAFEELGPDDAAGMLALATLTKPGPFRGRTQELGGFVGVKRDGKLIAMAGNRLRVEGFTELSGVCVHPDFRGQGLAGALSRVVVDRVLATGEQVFLHAYAGHEATIRLYRSLGFDVRARVTYTVLAG